MVSPSIQADVIDYDEYLTGERKEGSYFAAWGLVQKNAGGISAMITGSGLQFSGFRPSVEQSAATKLVLRAAVLGPPVRSVLRRRGALDPLSPEREGARQDSHEPRCSARERRDPEGFGRRRIVAVPAGCPVERLNPSLRSPPTAICARWLSSLGWSGEVRRGAFELRP